MLIYFIFWNINVINVLRFTMICERTILFRKHFNKFYIVEIFLITPIIRNNYYLIVIWKSLYKFFIKIRTSIFTCIIRRICYYKVIFRVIESKSVKASSISIKKNITKLNIYYIKVIVGNIVYIKSIIVKSHYKSTFTTTRFYDL